MGKLSTRIVASLRRQQMTAHDLSAALFVPISQVRETLSAMFEAGSLHRKFFHDARRGRPEYWWSATSFRSRPRYSRAHDAPFDAVDIVGLWDMTDMRRVKE